MCKPHSLLLLVVPLQVVRGNSSIKKNVNRSPLKVEAVIVKSCGEIDSCWNFHFKLMSSCFTPLPYFVNRAIPYHIKQN